MFCKNPLFKICCLSAILSVFLFSCSGKSHDSDNKTGSGESVLAITSTLPANGATEVAPDEPIVITFSANVNPDTVSPSSILVSDGSNQAQGRLMSSANTVTFSPGPLFSWGTTYTVTVTSGVKDRSGASLSSDYTWSFSTANQKELGRWIIVAAGWDNGAAINENGTLWGWGCNYSGQLGNGTGGDHSEEHQYDSHVPVQIGAGSNWADVSLGDHYAVAVKNDGTMWAWGDGYIGDGSTTTRKSPVRIGEGSSFSIVETSFSFYTLALTNDNSLWAWGLNTYGQFGNGTAGEGVTSRVPMEIGSSTDWAMLSAGKKHVVAIRNDGTLWAWGGNWYGQLGDGTGGDRTSDHDSHIPKRIGMEANWKIVSANGEFSLGIKTDGTLWAWGINQYGQLGDGTYETRNAPVRIGNATDWASVSAGWYHAAAIKNDGTLWAWGANKHGQLGDGTVIDKTLPVRIGSETDWHSLSSGKDFTLALKEDGTIRAWGYNNFGQVGDGTTVDKLVPTFIK